MISTLMQVVTGVRDYVIPFGFAVIRLFWSGGNFVTRDQAYDRWEICRECEEYDPERVSCKVCGCGMSPDVGGWRRLFEKLYYPLEKCPLNKWGKLK